MRLFSTSSGPGPGPGPGIKVVASVVGVVFEDVGDVGEVGEVGEAGEGMDDFVVGFKGGERGRKVLVVVGFGAEEAMVCCDSKFLLGCWFLVD